MHDRMQYLRMIYTCLYEASVTGGTCVDPIFFHFPEDVIFTNTPGHNETFIVANAVKVSPVVGPQAPGQDFYLSHFPPGRFVNLADLSEVIEGKYNQQRLKYRNKVNAHLMPGMIIPFQNNSAMTARTTNDLKRLPLSLIINRNQRDVAVGTVFLDGGNTYSEIENKTFEYYTIKHSGYNSTVKRSGAHSVQFLLSDGTRGTEDNAYNLTEIIIADAADLY
jgi:alpha-glucosidase (family GH31 glycosyl hydrolase)